MTDALTQALMDEEDIKMFKDTFIVLSRASDPIDDSPNRILFIIIGLMGGAIVGVGLAFVKHLFNNSYMTREQLEQGTGIQVIGVIPEFEMKECRRKIRDVVFFKKELNAEYDYLVTYEQPLSYVAEAFQKALVNLEYINIDNQFKVIQFTSTLAGAGKTTFISNISHLMGKKGKKVVIVDLDLRKPKINRIFRAPNEKGVTDYLTGKIDYKTLVNYSEKLNIHYIVAGEKTTAVVNVLEAQKLKDLITKLKEIGRASCRER